MSQKHSAHSQGQMCGQVSSAFLIASSCIILLVSCSSVGPDTWKEELAQGVSAYLSTELLDGSQYELAGPPYCDEIPDYEAEAGNVCLEDIRLVKSGLIVRVALLGSDKKWDLGVAPSNGGWLPTGVVQSQY